MYKVLLIFGVIAEILGIKINIYACVIVYFNNIAKLNYSPECNYLYAIQLKCYVALFYTTLSTHVMSETNKPFSILIQLHKILRYYIVMGTVL